MSITFKWSVNKVEVAPQKDGKTNVVRAVEWSATATSGEYTAIVSGVRQLSNAAVSDFFIEYPQLSEQTVLDWCFAPEVITWKDVDGSDKSVTKLLKDKVEAQLTDRINEQVARKEQEPALPWVEIPA
jgi:hypothetical protein